MRYIVLLSLLSLLFFAAPGQVALALSTEDDSGPPEKAPPQPPPSEPSGPISGVPGGPPGSINPNQPGGPPSGTTETETTGTTTGTTTETDITYQNQFENLEDMDVYIDTGEHAEGAVDLDVSTTADSDTDASGIDETGTGPATETGSTMDTDTAALPDTGPDEDARITCGEVRDINYEYYILSLGRRFGTRHYVVTPATMFSPFDLSLADIGPGSRVMISYVTLRGMRIAVHITVHE